MGDRGLGVLERAHRAEPADPNLAGQLAQRYARVGRVREAYRVCRRAELELPPEVGSALAHAQGLSLAGLGSPDADAQVATEQGPQGWLWRDLQSHLERPALQPLRALNLPWRRLTHRDLAAIGSLCSLTDLRLSGWDAASGRRLQALAALVELRALVLDYTSLGDLDLPGLGSFPALEHLQLAHCTLLSGADFGPVAELRKLRVLDLSYTHARAEGLTALVAHPSLEELRLQDCQALDDQALELLGTCPQLRLLDLSFCQGTSRAAREALTERRPLLKVLA